MTFGQHKDSFVLCALLSRMVIDEAMFICGHTYPKGTVTHVCPVSLKEAVFKLNDCLEHGIQLDTVTVRFSTGIESISICVNLNFIKRRIGYV